MPKLAATKLTAAVIDKIATPPKGARVERSDWFAPGLLLRVNDRGARSWLVQYRLAGKQTKIGIGDYPALSIKDARERAREVRDLAERGVDPKLARDARAAQERRATETFSHLADAFLDSWSPRGKNTKREMAATIALHLGPLAAVAKTELHRSHLSDITRALASPKRKGGAKPGAARKAFEAATRITRWAVSEGKLEHDPFALMKAPAKGAPRERVLDPDEVALLWQVWSADTSPFGPFQKLLLLTATRRNEVADMAWSELDDADAPTVWTIPAERAKNRQPHRIPLSAEARAVLASVERQAGPFVFSTTAGHRPLSGFTTAKRRADRMAAATAEAAGGEPLASWSLHDLRRTARTGFARLGVAREVAERCINHVGGSQLERTYDRHRYEAEIADAFARWGAEVTRITGGAPESKIIALPRRA
jgi:integrase